VEVLVDISCLGSLLESKTTVVLVDAKRSRTPGIYPQLFACFLENSRAMSRAHTLLFYFIIIIIINCNWVSTWWQCSVYKYKKHKH
jgi:hypothetical protein